MNASANSRRAAKVSAVTPLLLVAQFVIAPAQQPPPARAATGRVKGTVSDWQPARILGACLTFKAKSFEKNIKVDEDGAFEVELPAGTYEVTAHAFHFEQFRLKALRVEPNATRTLDITLKLAPERVGECPEGTKKRGRLCVSLCEQNAAPAGSPKPAAP